LDIPNDLIINTFPGVWAQIITNFIDNSIAHGFAPDSREKEIRITVNVTDTFNFTYSDNGVGMSSEQIKRVFEPFYTTKRGQGGTGLGMSICYNLVTQKLQGSIECPENLSSGVSFSITCAR
jgi:signal transduction histidine kinase